MSDTCVPTLLSKGTCTRNRYLNTSIPGQNSLPSYLADSAEPQHGTIQQYMLRTAPLNSGSTNDKMVPGGTPGKVQPPPSVPEAFPVSPNSVDEFPAPLQSN